MLTMASAVCMHSPVGGVHCIIMLERKKEVNIKGAVDSPSGINIKCWCTERKKETPLKLKRQCFALA